MAVEAQLVLQRLLIQIDPITKDQQKIRHRSDSISITSSTDASPIVITAATAHGLKTGDKVFIHSHTTNTNANNTLANPSWTITRTSATAFSLDGSTATGGGAGSSGSIIPAYVGSVDGDKLTRERHLEIYNQARWALMGFVLNIWREDIRTGRARLDPEKILNGWIKEKTDLTFASGVASKPSDFIAALKLYDDSSPALAIPIYTPTEYDAVKDELSATNPAVQELGTTFDDPTNGTNVPNDDDFVLHYFGLTDFVLGDILQLSGYTQTTETLDEQSHELLYRAAIAIARGAGAADLNNLFAKELGIV